MRLTKFEQLDSWKAARSLVRLVYKITYIQTFSKDFCLRDQIRRSAISVMANVAEGFATKSDLEFIRFLGYSTRSAVEVQSHLYIALDLGYINKNYFDEAYRLTQDCANLSRGLIRYLKSKPKANYSNT